MVNQRCGGSDLDCSERLQFEMVDHTWIHVDFGAAQATIKGVQFTTGPESDSGNGYSQASSLNGIDKLNQRYEESYLDSSER